MSLSLFGQVPYQDCMSQDICPVWAYPMHNLEESL